MHTTIRPYTPADRPALEALCIATGLRGTLAFAEPRLFAELWLNPYLRREPDQAFVAEAEGRVVGYLVGSVRPGFERRAVLANLRPLARLAWALLAGRYRHDPQSAKVARWILTRLWREAPPHPPGLPHLHFNVEAGHRGREIGQSLIDAFEARLRELGRPGYYGTVFSDARRRSPRLFERFGYTIHAQRPCSLFDGDVSFCCLVKWFGENADESLGGAAGPQRGTDDRRGADGAPDRRAA